MLLSVLIRCNADNGFQRSNDAFFRNYPRRLGNLTENKSSCGFNNYIAALFYFQLQRIKIVNFAAVLKLNSDYLECIRRMPKTGKSCSDRLIGYCLGNIYYQPVENRVHTRI